MENEQVSLPEHSAHCSINSDSSQNIDNKNKELRDEEQNENARTSPELTLDLRRVLPACELTFENEDSVEKLSAVLEQPEDASIIVDDVLPLEDDHEDRNYILRERIESLRQIMNSLKEDLKREVELWRKEREELQLLREKGNALALQEATAAARAAAAAYATESPLSNHLGNIFDLSSDDTFTELTILEYEKRLAKYQDMNSFNQAEIRYNACWKSIANIYKQKLIDIERLCNEELEKVQQNASTLQPLKEMVSQWYTEEKNHGDTIKTYEFRADALTGTIFDKDAHSRHNFQNFDAEVNMAPEIFVAKFTSEDLTKRDRCYAQP